MPGREGRRGWPCNVISAQEAPDGRRRARDVVLPRDGPSTYLFVHFCSTLDLGYYHSHNGASVGGRQGKKLLVGSDVPIPGVRVSGKEQNRTKDRNQETQVGSLPASPGW